MTRLKWLRSAQPLPGDALGRSADWSLKGMDGREPSFMAALAWLAFLKSQSQAVRPRLFSVNIIFSYFRFLKFHSTILTVLSVTYITHCVFLWHAHPENLCVPHRDQDRPSRWYDRLRLGPLLCLVGQLLSS